MSSCRELLLQATRNLQTVSSTPRLDAELLLRHVLNLSRERLILEMNKSCGIEEVQRFHDLIKRRLAHEPVAYILGHKEFFGISFKVDRRVLVPRPETELLVEQSIALLKDSPEARRVLELGTGSACISIALAANTSNSISILAADCSPDALELASENVRSLNLESRIQCVRSDWYSNIKPEKFDLIVSNPPYVRRDDPGISAELAYEPENALFAEESGLSEIRKIIQGAETRLNSGARLLIEHGSEQQEQINKLLAGLSFPWKHSFLYDLANLPRVCMLWFE